jgi:hypothetical protein
MIICHIRSCKFATKARRKEELAGRKLSVLSWEQSAVWAGQGVINGPGHSPDPFTPITSHNSPTSFQFIITARTAPKNVRLSEANLAEWDVSLDIRRY